MRWMQNRVVDYGSMTASTSAKLLQNGAKFQTPCQPSAKVSCGETLCNRVGRPHNFRARNRGRRSCESSQVLRFVKGTVTVISSRWGDSVGGTVARCNTDVADHLTTRCPVSVEMQQRIASSPNIPNVAAVRRGRRTSPYATPRSQTRMLRALQV